MIEATCTGTEHYRYVNQDAAPHWDNVFKTQAPGGMSWFQEQLATSLRLITAALPERGSLIDVGAGASTLVDGLLDAGWSDITVLDVSAGALAKVRARLQLRNAAVDFVVADLLSWHPDRTFDAWHDRAAFHFLVRPDDQDQYVETATRAVAHGGALVLGVFASDGPEHCSGLPTARYGAGGLADRFAPHFDLVTSEREEHVTPNGHVQPFTWVVLRRA